MMGNNFSINEKINVITILFFLFLVQSQAQSPVDYVNTFIGTSNYGATHPGPLLMRLSRKDRKIGLKKIVSGILAPMCTKINFLRAFLMSIYQE